MGRIREIHHTPQSRGYGRKCDQDQAHDQHAILNRRCKSPDYPLQERSLWSRLYHGSGKMSFLRSLPMHSGSGSASRASWTKLWHQDDHLDFSTISHAGLTYYDLSPFDTSPTSGVLPLVPGSFFIISIPNPISVSVSRLAHMVPGRIPSPVWLTLTLRPFK